MTSSLPKRHNVNYIQKPFNPEKYSINDLKNKTQVNAAETTLEKVNRNFDIIDKSEMKNSDTFRNIFKDINSISELKLDDNNYIAIFTKIS